MRLVGHSLNRVLAPAGLRLVRTGSAPPAADPPRRDSTGGALAQLARTGLTPQTVVDVGAAFGEWSGECASHFPDARYILVEPLREFTEFLDERVRSLGRARYISAAASARTGSLTLNVHPDLVGSSLRSERERGLELVEREVPATTLDDLVEADDAAPSFLVKLDVQGAELDVLRGAPNVLRLSEAIVVESLLYEFYDGAPQFSEVIGFMHDHGFAVYDIFGLGYRLLDDALAQVDLVFVPEQSPLRADHVYASPEQRRHQNSSFRAEFERRRRALRGTHDT